MKHTLIFDFDGTICDSYLESLRMMNELAPEFGYKVVDESVFESLKDQSHPQFRDTLDIAVHKIPAVLIQGRKRMRAKAAGLAPVAGLPEVLRELARLELRLGILTSNSRENVELFLERNGLDMFEFIHGESTMFGKARLLKKIMKKFKLEAGHVAYVGDEARDVKAANTAGVESVAVSWGFNSLRLLNTAEPKVILAKPAELLTYALARKNNTGSL
ncbi:MAG: HAD-IA family hydrolase [Deltaproteobacteria bacterium]|nr:HAD-IA family hydrolase [Deltaproteobacteria bacterium]